MHSRSNANSLTKPVAQRRVTIGSPRESSAPYAAIAGIIGVLTFLDAAFFSQGNLDVKWAGLFTGILIAAAAASGIAHFKPAGLILCGLGILLGLLPWFLHAPYPLTYTSDTTAGAIVAFFGVVVFLIEKRSKMR